MFGRSTVRGSNAQPSPSRGDSFTTTAAAAVVLHSCIPLMYDTYTMIYQVYKYVRVFFTTNRATGQSLPVRLSNPEGGLPLTVPGMSYVWQARKLYRNPMDTTYVSPYRPTVYSV